MKRLLPKPPPIPRRKKDRKGGRPKLDDRLAFSGILWVIRSGETWWSLPSKFGSHYTVKRRLREWWRSRLLHKLFEVYLQHADEDEVRLWGIYLSGARGRRNMDWLDDLIFTYRYHERALRLAHESGRR